MLNKALLNTSIQQFIKTYTDDVSKLAFAGSPFENVSTKELIQQIESYRKAEKKLPTWYNADHIIFPPKLNLEQTSSEITAQYKASLVKGNTIADITGGFGVDSFYFSKNFKTLHHFETNRELSQLAAHNFEALKATNIQCFAEDGLKEVLNTKYDLIYSDPSRRHASKGKVFFLKDCEPNIPAHISELTAQCEVLLLKTSPMLDIAVGLNELQKVSEIHIVAIENEVKELLWLISENASTQPQIKTVNFTKTAVETFSFKWNTAAEASYSSAQKYLYEPNASILKSGAFHLISEAYKLDKFHKNTHLYTSDTLQDFPGRRFLIEEVVPYTKTDMRKALHFKKANLSIRNFPESVAVLRKKWKIADGGDKYLFFITDLNDKKQMLVCSKV